MEMTTISKRAFEEATSQLRTIEEAVSYLEKETKLRSIKSKLNRFYQEDNLNVVLVNGIIENHPEMKKESVERRIRGWLKANNYQAIKKSDAIEVCFILKLSVKESNALISLISEEGLHWRNPDEIVFIYALKQGMNYLEAKELHEVMKQYLSEVKESKNISEDNFTAIVRNEVMAINHSEELKEYLVHSQARLGRYHNTAYHLFEYMMNKLECPPVDSSREMVETLSVRDVLKEYLYEKNVIYAKQEALKLKKAQNEDENHKLLFSIIQKQISDGWPDETVISKMKKRKADVTRKLLILLFLATDEGIDFDDEDYEIEVNANVLFEDIYERMNDMLFQCGFQQLDPRSPFDWMVIYSMCIGDVCEMDEHMYFLLKEMFGEKPETTKEI